ncbi:MAG TPA: hypothetical protein PLD02_06450 [Saprospiraceae bacterium]|nr:hypothetical protein [Saprospiraceae bacterium]
MAVNLLNINLNQLLQANKLCLFLIFILLFSCSSAKFPYSDYKQMVPNNTCHVKIFPNFDYIVFNTNIEILNKNLSGLLLLKKMPDSTTRFVFTNEFGNTYFDFQFTQNQFKIISIIDYLDKKPVINQLKTDLGLLIGYQNSNPIKNFNNNSKLYHTYEYNHFKNVYITDTLCEQLLSLECFNKNKKQTEIKCFGTKNNFPDSLFITHMNYHFNLSLKQIVQ